MATLIDANVILRYLIGDIEAQATQAEAAIRDGAYTLPEVLAEVVYVLEGVYEQNSELVASTLTQLLEEIDIESKPILRAALKTHAEQHIDFIDAILVARSRLLGEHVLSFDKKLNRLL